MTRPGVYRHHNGPLYQVLFDAIDATTGAEGVRMVVYIGLTLDGARPGVRWRVRAAEEFHEPVRWPDGSTRPRFEFLGEEWAP